MKHILFLFALTTTLYAAGPVSTVTGTPGLVAFWDFVKREPAGAHRFTGWIGGVAVFNRALSAEELAALAALRSPKPAMEKR